MSSGIRVRGLNDTVRALKKVGAPNKEIAEATGAAAEVVATASRTLVPRRTGLLESTIRTAKQARKGIVRAGNARVPYANPIHWGWFRRNIEPNRFFVKGMAQNIDKVYGAFAREIQRLVDKYNK